MKKTRFVKIIFLLLLIMSFTPINGEIQYQLVYPVFTLTELNNQTSYYNQVLDPILQNLINLFTQYADKPDFLKAFAEANGFTAPAGNLFHPVAFQNFALCFEALAGAQLFSFDYKKVADYFRNDFNLTSSDPYLGISAQPLSMNLTFPVKKVFPAIKGALSGSIANVQLGCFATDYFSYRFEALNCGIQLSNKIFPVIGAGKIIQWTPLSFSTGFALLYNNISYTIKNLTPVSHTETIDPDGAGPYPAFLIGVEVQPEPKIGIRSLALQVPINFSSTIELGWFFFFSMGLNLNLCLASSAIYIDERSDLTITGDLVPYVSSPGSLAINGDALQNLAFPLRLQLALAIGFHIEPLYIQVPLVYNIDNGIRAGINIGINF